MLLYLAVLGGEAYSGYHDCSRSPVHGIIAYSTKSIFLEQLDGVEFSGHENTHTESRDFKTFENMVAHALFCASRRNGVQGILFNDFYAWLLGEFQAMSTMVKMTVHDASGKKEIVASDLFDGYSAQEAMRKMVIPFLAPPNAEWPQYILNTRDHGCNFDHLVRACNSDRCDVFIRSAGSEARTALFLCECKRWGRIVSFRAMQRIIRGLNAKWQWEFVLVFCEELAHFHPAWKHEEIGCVKIGCQDGDVEWVFQPKEGNRKKLVVVMQTGKTGLPARG
ncbi:hypothetical protein PF003_g25913 [Phytophthora fragariae]|nr:hypothetical protein PF003_g25913 [Phytophthora fragariae]